MCIRLGGQTCLSLWVKKPSWLRFDFYRCATGLDGLVKVIYRNRATRLWGSRRCFTARPKVFSSGQNWRSKVEIKQASVRWFICLYQFATTQILPEWLCLHYIGLNQQLYRPEMKWLCFFIEMCVGARKSCDIHSSVAKDVEVDVRFASFNSSCHKSIADEMNKCLWSNCWFQLKAEVMWCNLILNIVTHF